MNLDIFNLQVRDSIAVSSMPYLVIVLIYLHIWKAMKLVGNDFVDGFETIKTITIEHQLTLSSGVRASTEPNLRRFPFAIYQLVKSPLSID